MQVIQEFCIIARWRWLKDWTNSLDANNKPMAYFVAFICVCFMIAAIVAVLREWYRYWGGTGNAGSSTLATLKLLPAIIIPAALLYVIVGKLGN